MEKKKLKEQKEDLNNRLAFRNRESIAIFQIMLNCGFAQNIKC